jgi:ferric-dicitrate binding protein FerR (iron transport regulator)
VNTDPIDSDLLALYLAGGANDVQRLTVEQWAAASAENALELERMRRIWTLTESAGDMPFFDVDAAFTKVESRITEAESKGRVIPIGTGPRWMAWIAAAAVIAGLVFAAQLFWRSPEPEVLFADASPVEKTLQDNSNVVLSEGTRMEVLITDQRRVKLQGQAYFEVKRDEQKPFIVETGDVQVTVLGTSFSVTAYDTSEYVLVRVRSGLVRVSGGEETVELKAGEHARYHRTRHFLERPPAPPTEVWGLRILQFEGATLQQVADQLQRIYKVQIDLRNPQISSCKLTAEFDNESIAMIMNVIAETFGLELRHPEERYFILDGDGC